MEPEPTDAQGHWAGDAVMFGSLNFSHNKGSGAILSTGDEVQIHLGGAVATGHVVESTQYKSGYIVKYRPIGRDITCIASVLPGITHLPGIYGPPRNYDIYWSTAYMYYKDPQDSKRLHIWPCPVSVKNGWLSTDLNIYQLAQQRIDHIIELQKYQNSQLEVTPGTAVARTSKQELLNEQEVSLHKSWWR